MIELINANTLAIPLAEKSVHMIAFSPPYWGLRSYQTGDNKHAELGAEPLHDCLGWATGSNCGACFVCNLRNVAAECWRVLRDDGVMFINLGDSYANTGVSDPSKVGGFTGERIRAGVKGIMDSRPKSIPPGLKPKDLCGIPWRVALALQSDGWYLRSDIIWAKPNPMPESVTDRPTKAHEYVFLFSKSQKYFWDQEAVREGQDPASLERLKRGWNGNGERGYPNGPQNHLKKYMGKTDEEIAALPGRNIRTVWNVATYSYSGSHFATWPPALVEKMIRAGSRIGDIVLDPFAGSGTTLMVARKLGRSAIGLDLSYTYLHDNARERLMLDALEDWENGRQVETTLSDLPMFGGMP